MKIDDIKNKFRGFKEKVQDFIDGNRKLALILLVAILLILILLVMLIVGSASKGSKSVSAQEPNGAEAFEDSFIPPQDATLGDDYYFSRNTEEQWSKEEADSYFTVPTPSVIDELRKDNDSLVEEILGAAP